MLNNERKIPSSPHEYFSLLVNASKSGEFPAANGTVCLYRTEDGRACAVGIIMPDDYYKKLVRLELTIKSYKTIATECGRPEWLPSWLDDESITSIQSCHDNVCWNYNGNTRDTWKHDVFVEKLLKVPLFSGMVPNG